MIVLSLLFVLSFGLVMLSESFHHQQIANQDVSHYYQRQIMKQLMMVDYRQNPEKYTTSGTVNFNIGQIQYQKTTTSMSLLIYLKTDSMKIKDSFAIENISTEKNKTIENPSSKP